MTRRRAPFPRTTITAYLLVAVVAFAVAFLIVKTAEGATSRQTVTFRLHKTESVLRFFHNRPWMVAKRAEKCWEVAWQPTCRIARGLVRTHTERRETLRRNLRYHLPVSGDWVTSVRIVQRAFPGTASWLLSCSSAEGGHGRFVLYGGRAYYPGAEHSHTFHGNMVGGNLQYMWPTFKGHYRRGLDDIRARGFRVDLPPAHDVRAWLSPTAQAIAGAWGISHGQRGHWYASYGRGC